MTAAETDHIDEFLSEIPDEKVEAAALAFPVIWSPTLIVASYCFTCGEEGGA